MGTELHPLCRDTARDEAIRRAEAAAAAKRVPLPDHRDLPQAVAELRERVSKLEQTARPCGGTDPASSGCAPGEAGTGLRTERVTLEITMPNGGREYHGDASSWDWTAILSHGKNFFGPGESVRVVDETDDQSDLVCKLRGILQVRDSHIVRLTAERDAAIRERDEAKEECERLREQVVIRCTTAANLHSVIRERDQKIVALEARVAELEAAAAPAANAGGEAKQEPVAWGVMWDHGGVVDTDNVYLDKSLAEEMVAENGEQCTVVPLFSSPQPPRGWLTEEVRLALMDAADRLHNYDSPGPRHSALVIRRFLEGTPDAPRGWLTADERVAVEEARDSFEDDDDRHITLASLLARSTPPRVRSPRPKVIPGGTVMELIDHINEAWVAAIREAGGEVE